MWQKRSVLAVVSIMWLILPGLCFAEDNRSREGPSLEATTDWIANQVNNAGFYFVDINRYNGNENSVTDGVTLSFNNCEMMFDWSFEIDGHSLYSRHKKGSAKLKL